MVGCDVVANDTDLSVAEVAPAFWPPLLVLVLAVLAMVGGMCQTWGMCCCKGAKDCCKSKPYFRKSR